MPCRRLFLFAVFGLALPVGAQSVISTRSGVLHFFEGSVYLNGQPLEPHLGRYPTMPQGGELRTEDGRAEVLLTPGVFLRMGERSSIRLVANDLGDTRVELLTGSAIVDSGEPNPGTSVTLSYRDWKVHFLEKGAYRIDADPARLWVRQGEAEVWAGIASEPVSVRQGMNLAFGGLLLPEQASGQSSVQSSVQSKDAFNDWANGRSESIAADNAITAQIDEDPASQARDLDSFTYFPMVGVPPYDPAFASMYPSFAPYQPGFSSIYLPGYMYRPYIIGMPVRGLRTYLPSGYLASPPRPIGVSTGVRPISPGVTPLPRGPGVAAAPVSRPAPVRVAPAAPHAAGHAGGHR